MRVEVENRGTEVVSFLTSAQCRCMNALPTALSNSAHSSPRCEGLFPPTTRTILHQPYSRPTFPGSSFFGAHRAPKYESGGRTPLGSRPRLSPSAPTVLVLEDVLDPDIEHPRDPQREKQRRRVLVRFQRDDR